MNPRDTELAKSIRLILSDVDGVMTDGRLIFDNAGLETKAYHGRDGQALRWWLQAGLSVGWLTQRNSRIVKLWASELGVTLVRQGVENKRTAALEMIASLSLTPAEVCYIGDDLPDLPILAEVGLAVAVADAVPEVKSICRLVTTAPAGGGAVREVVERLLKAKGRWEDCVPR